MKFKTRGIELEIGKFSVNTLDTNSGVFIGTNIANHWSSSNKSNSGLGSVSDAKVYKNKNIVIDNDTIDSPIDDRDIILCNNTNPHNLENLAITFDRIDVNALDTNSTISIGQNSQFGWSSHSKNNFGTGTFYGKNFNSQNSNLIVDDDVIDAPINDQDFKPSFVVQAI